MSLVHLPPGYHFFVDQFRQWCTKAEQSKHLFRTARTNAPNEKVLARYQRQNQTAPRQQTFADGFGGNRRQHVQSGLLVDHSASCSKLLDTFYAVAPNPACTH